MSIIDRLQDHMKKKNIKLPKVASATGIPYDRMYKWTKGEGSPKADDSKKLEDFISGKTSNNSARGGTDSASQNLENEENDYFKLLCKAMDVIHSQQRTIESQHTTIHEIAVDKKKAASG